ncbi:putative polyketide synthase [Nemania sp. FL0916]|nr:putative polyketide synthase [Nemania sp. FL0916]
MQIHLAETEGIRDSVGTMPAVASLQNGGVCPKAKVNGQHSYSNGEDDLICITGIACRLPGDVKSPSEMWNFISQGKSAKGQVPGLRFNMKGFHHPDGGRAGVMPADGGYFIQHDVRQFENTFFGLNNLEAMYMDPQQRQLLEVTYECLENAGIPLDQISGSNTGVFVGNFTMDYQTMQSRDPDYGSRYTATGTGTAIMANRISHIFNLHGPRYVALLDYKKLGQLNKAIGIVDAIRCPVANIDSSFTIDTACSSSIYCLHNAIRAIKANDCDSAIVAAANLITSPEQHLGTMKGGVLSPTSTCHTFDVSADGYGRAEAVNAIYVKRLSKAIEDGDHIWAVIRGSAINANGKTSGIAQPSATFQEAVIRKAYADARLRFDDTDYVECHGTGTAVGDPTEVDALASCFLPREDIPLKIGSVKTNFGHSEAASGLTSIIKVALAFETGLIAPTAGITKINPKLKLESRAIRVVTSIESWPRELRRASVNSFGYGGANAHVILESLSSYMSTVNNHSRAIPTFSERTFVLPVSASSEKSLKSRVEQTTRALGHANAETLGQLAFTLAERRSHLGSRSYILAESSTDGLSSENRVVKIHDGEASGAVPLPFAFAFTGQGAQYAGMAKELLETDETFASTISALDRTLSLLPLPYRPSWTLQQTLQDPAEANRIHEVSRSQPLCTAIQIGLVDVLRSWSVKPSAVIGHSSGEIAAAYACGILTSAQAILIAYLRGYAVEQLNKSGTMMALGLSAEVAQGLIKAKGLEDQVCVACVNAPESVTMSGSADGIDTIGMEAQIHHQGKLARKLETGGRAYHSHMMADIGSLYEQVLAEHVGIVASEGPLSAKMYSSAGFLGDQLRIFDGKTKLLPRYWRENLEKPVQFNAAVTSLVSSGRYHLIEIGPHSALRGYVQQIRTSLDIEQRHLPYTPTLVRKEDSHRRLKDLAGQLYVYGHQLIWSNVNGLPESGVVPLHGLPTYPWDHSAGLLWYEPRASVELRNRKHIRHELLGSRQLAGDGTNYSWRNILCLNEMPWIRGHRVDSQIVFPATGYLAVAMEALSQIIGLRDQLESPESERNYTFEFENVNIKAALVIEETDEINSGKELHTTMSPRKLSAATASSHVYDFSIYSWTAGLSTLHCAGGIRIDYPKLLKGSVEVQGMEMETWSPEPWYEKGRQQGLCFEGDFKSLTSLRTDVNRFKPESICTTNTTPPSALDPHAMHYPMHPITIDACLQAAIMGSTAGQLDTLRAYLPVFISKAKVRPLGNDITGSEAAIHTRARRTGVATMEIDSTLRNANNEALIDLAGVRLSLYASKQLEGKSDALERSRHPCLRATWKPDLQKLDAGSRHSLDQYIIETLKQSRFEPLPEGALGSLGVLLDLAGHKNPGMRVLTVGDIPADVNAQFHDILDGATSFRRFSSWDAAQVNEDGEMQIEDAGKTSFDAIIIPNDLTQQFWHRNSDQLSSLLAENGMIMAISSPEATALFSPNAYHATEVHGEILVARKISNPISLEDRDVLILSNEPSLAVLRLGSDIADYIKANFGVSTVKTVSFAELNQTDISEKTICISMMEIEREILASMGEKEMNQLRVLTNSVKDLVWITGAGMLDNPNPDLTLSHGLSRALMLEQPTLRWSIMDVGRVEDHEPQILSKAIANMLSFSRKGDDKEFIYSRELLFINRFSPDSTLNTLFSRRQSSSSTRLQLQELGKASPAKLSIGQIGQMDSLYFQQLERSGAPPPAGHIDVSVQAVSLNAKDVYVLNGRAETKTGTITNDFSGIVTAVGPDVNQFAIGDRVVVMAPSDFKTVERVPAWTAQKILPSESFAEMASLPIVYSTAFYALHDRAHLRRGESILIHSGGGALGIALINVARHIGAVIYTTVGSDVKRQYLVEQFGIPDSNIFSSRDLSFAEGIRTCTSGRGVDVVVSSLVGDLMHASWECIGQFGRFVEVGKRELLDAGRLGMEIFLRNATFTAFDLTEIFYHDTQMYRDTWSRLLADTLDFYRSGKVTPAPTTVFDVGEIGQAYRYFSNRDRIGKVIVSLENPAASVPVAPTKYSATFAPDKVYLLVGCLGGLGRCLSRWMLARGARRFCFMGRSGLQNPAAKALVDQLRASGATVEVVKGDVSRAADVSVAVNVCHQMGQHIGGVVQAAMGLREALFNVMDNQAWQMAVQPKWAGTWNLHRAIEGHDQALDFFLLMSSMSGSVGTATESNYCAANGFLDAFAGWRRAQGKPAVSVGLGMISEVGYLHENPQVEELLLRRGIQPLNEEEFLQVIDLSLSETGGNATHDEQSSLSESMILTGLEPFGFLKLMDRGFDVDLEVVSDPRLALLSAAVSAEKASRRLNSGGSVKPNLSHIIATTPWLQGLPSGIAESLALVDGATSLSAAVLQLTRQRFSNLILVSVDNIDEDKPFSRFGVDSMIAAEFRTWLWNTFEVDVPFLDLLGAQMNLSTVTKVVSTKLANNGAPVANGHK